MNTEDLKTRRQAIVSHPVYGMLRTRPALATFTEHHVYALWARLTLTRALQRRVNGVDLPWRPSTFPTRFVRAINRMVLDAESDRFEPLHDLSHFELYLQAMQEVGADPAAVRGLIDSGGLDPEGLPNAAEPLVAFIDQTATRGMNEEVTAVLYHGFATLSADVGAGILRGIGHFGHDAHLLRTYAARRLQLDEARDVTELLGQLLSHMTRGDVVRSQWARQAAQRVLDLRAALWDGAAAAISRQRSDLPGVGGRLAWH